MVEKIREPYQRHARNISTVSDISTTGSTGQSGYRVHTLGGQNKLHFWSMINTLQGNDCIL